MLGPDVRQAITARDPYADVDRLSALRTTSPSNVATTLDLVFYLAEDNLVQTDRSSMATALEVRAPFLDRRLAEYVFGLPAETRRGIWRTKPLLRRAARAVLPARVSRRPKHGFGVPTGSWLRREVRNLVDDVLAPGRLRRQGIFDVPYVSQLVERHMSGAANHRKELWTLLMFELWALAYCAA